MSDTTVSVSLQELDEIWTQLREHLRSTGVENLELPVDPYWEVQPDERYDVYQHPEQLTIGLLSDDLAELRKMLVRESPIGYGLVWFAALLRAIGEHRIERVNQHRNFIVPITQGLDAMSRSAQVFFRARTAQDFDAVATELATFLRVRPVGDAVRTTSRRAVRFATLGVRVVLEG